MAIQYQIVENAKEFLAGMAYDHAESSSKNIAAAEKTIKQYIDSINTDLRSVYDKYIPNISIISAEVLTNLIVNALVKNNQLIKTETYVNPEDGDLIDESAASARYIQQLTDKKSNEYNSLYHTINTALHTWHTSLISSQGEMVDPITTLNTLQQNTYKDVRNISNTVQAQAVGKKFNQKIRQVFGSKAILASTNTQLYTNAGKDTYVFFQVQFTQMGDAIREKVYKPIISHIIQQARLNAESTSLQVGQLVNLGHAQLRSVGEDKKIKHFVNSPAFAQVLYGYASGSANNPSIKNIAQAASYFKKESKIIDNYVEVTKDLSANQQGINALLVLGVTITNVEDAFINQDRGRRYEKAAVSAFNIKKAQKPGAAAINSLVARIKDRILKKRPELGTSSLSIIEFLDKSFGMLATTGKLNVKEKTNKLVSNKTKVTKLIPDSKQVAVFKAKKSTTKKVPIQKSIAPEPTLNLTNLQNLLNQRLHDQIKANMGTGQSRSTLNYRSGRLAQSAQVERMSESRTGMLTAFYQYMKYPYATFSDGGAQQYPRQRNPKLLIAKSIREIAGTSVANRMRAVNI